MLILLRRAIAEMEASRQDLDADRAAATIASEPGMD